MELYITRDSYGDLFLWDNLPGKGKYEWDNPLYETNYMRLPSKMFPEVKWSDKEPTKVKLIIEK